MDWAENVYSPFFPSHEPDLRADPFTYRYYPSTQNYLGVAADASGVSRVYIFGPISGGVLADVGALADFSERVLAGVAPASDALAARFLSQATLGYTEADIAALRAAGGYRAWLQAEMAKPISTSNWDWLVSKGYDTNANAMTGLAGFDSSIWQRLITAPDGLRQRMALALSEFFVVGVDGVTGNWKPFRMAAYWDLLAANAFGNYRTLLEQVTLSVAMGNYLNMAGNQKENAATGRVPDENYAREVMQLFSIGLVELNLDGTPKLNSQGQPIETYTQDMVTQLARVFTGWDFDRSGSGTTVPEFARKPMVLNANLHSNLAASFLGVTVPANTAGAAALKIALDTLAAHPNVGPFLGKQLIQRLVTSNPSPYYVARVAKVFNDNGQGVRGDLGAVVRAVLLDDEARDPAKLSDPSWGKLREPMLRAIQWARAFKANSLTGNWNLGNTSDPSRSLGQSPQRSPSVFNYFRPGYVPAGSAIGTASLVAPEFQLSNETSVAGYLNAMQNVVGSGHSDVKPNYVSELAVAADANALLDRVVVLLNGTALSTTSRATILGALNAIAATSDTGKANRVYAAVFLVLASPDYLVQK
ncbi:DUF1800 domain-containing protein [Inhella sp. 4Y17]|uniref:DUF1800 domain-containing protein n=2 Tax=Inhella gelatinilytica TaxID=2795030 RepID=A0A931J2P0_9BURK|nr:DUF1800 domain-containing protein [Inhella gelatinilytica]